MACARRARQTPSRPSRSSRRSAGGGFCPADRPWCGSTVLRSRSPGTGRRPRRRSRHVAGPLDQTRPTSAKYFSTYGSSRSSRPGRAKPPSVARKHARSAGRRRRSRPGLRLGLRRRQRGLAARGVPLARRGRVPLQLGVDLVLGARARGRRAGAAAPSAARCRRPGPRRRPCRPAALDVGELLGGGRRPRTPGVGELVVRARPAPRSISVVQRVGQRREPGLAPGRVGVLATASLTWRSSDCGHRHVGTRAMPDSTQPQVVAGRPSRRRGSCPRRRPSTARGAAPRDVADAARPSGRRSERSSSRTLA